MTQVATQTVQVLAYVTIKTTNLTYTLYPVASRTSDATYAVWTINGKPTHCTCKDRKFRPWKMCDHMTQWLQESKQETPACPIIQELKTSFASIEEEFEYKLGAYGKKIAYGWLYEQKHAARTAAKLVAQYREDGSLHTVVCIDGQFADTTTDAEVVAAVEEVKAEAKMAAFQQGMDEQYARDPRQGISQGERETAISNMRHFYDEW